MKTLKFKEDLSNQILMGEKTSTIRLFDDKDLSKGDILGFAVAESGKNFATAQISSVIEKKIGEITEEDLNGHKKYIDQKEMIEELSQLYNREVDSETVAKIILFNIICKRAY